jgi:CubicO group peptidase (beta-lactamase class C family)
MFPKRTSRHKTDDGQRNSRRQQQPPSLLGPGRGPWQRGSPEAHGLSAEALSSAAQRVADTVPTRDCLLVVKDGVLVHESYPTGGETQQYETDSLGKVFTAAVVGAAVQAGALDIDIPLTEYGLTSPTVPGAWNRSGVDFWSNVTARHLLTQVTTASPHAT